MRKTASLLDEIRRSGENRELVTEVIALSKQYRIATPYTSFLVLESEAAYDQQGIDRKGNTFKPPSPTVQAPSPAPTRINVPTPDAPGATVRRGPPRDDQGVPPQEPAIFSPETKESDHNESNDNEDFHAKKGDSKDLLGYSKLSTDEYPDPIEPGRILKFGETMKKALQWLISQQDPEGLVGTKTPKHLYDHAIAALALSEAYGMTAAAPLKEPAQKAVDYLVAAQNPGKGWRYSARCKDNDTSVTGWAATVLMSADPAGLTYPRSAAEGALAWFDEVTDDVGRSGYANRGPHKGVP